MLMDGIFDTAVNRQGISCFIDNTGSTDLTDVKVFLESASGINFLGSTYRFDKLAVGGAVLVSWEAYFFGVSSGVHYISVVVEARNVPPTRIIKKIFVVSSTKNRANQTYTSVFPEGKLTAQFLRCLGRAPVVTDDKAKASSGFLIPQKVRAELENSFKGIEGPIPFEDPLHKAILAGLAALCFLASYVLTQRWAIGVVIDFDGSNNYRPSGTQPNDFAYYSEPTDSDCIPGLCRTSAEDSPSPGLTPEGAAGIALVVIGSLLLRAALADGRDPWIRGRELTPPQDLAGEQTIKETLEAEIDYPKALELNEDYALGVQWKYTRTTEVGGRLRQYHHEVKETANNPDALKKRVLSTNSPVSLSQSPLLIVTAEFVLKDGTALSGSDVYGIAIFGAPDGSVYRRALSNNVDQFGSGAKRGVYRAILNLSQLERPVSSLIGNWAVHVVAQRVNAAREGDAPMVAAQYFGGGLLATSFGVKFSEGEYCPRDARLPLSISVVQ
jgi:hypothetical protein